MSVSSAAPLSPTSSAPSVPPGSWLLMRVWLLLGVQSFGGGGATLTLIRRAIVDRYGWISDDTFTRDWAICQVCPGINLLCFTILVGRRIAGVRGIVLCLIGLLVPSVAATIAITAVYAHIRDSDLVKAALRAVIPASVGLGLLTAVDMARAPLKESAQEGKPWLVFAVLLAFASGLLLALYQPPVALILGGVGALSGGLRWLRDLFGRPVPDPLDTSREVPKENE